MVSIADMIFVYPVIPFALFLLFFAVLKRFGKMDAKKALIVSSAVFAITLVIAFLIILGTSQVLYGQIR